MIEIDDDILIALIKKGDTHAEALLCSKYWTFARNLARKFYSLYSDLGFTVDDFAGVAFSSIVVAIKKYKPSNHGTFHSYWLIVAKNQCINFVKDNSYLGLSDLRPLSLDSATREEGLTLHETFGYNDYKIKSDINSKQIHDFVTSPECPLSDDEKIAAYYMLVLDYDFQDLLHLTKWNKPKLYRVCRNARKKVSNFLESGYFVK